MTFPLDRIAEASTVRPSPRQIAWQQLEFYGFIHFGMNTMTDREWGLGHEDPQLFDPDRLDADQWVVSLMSAGMKALILTCKHHDGFCLWPSEVTHHSVASSPWRNGKGDLVAEVSDACARHGIKFGIYLSPWDRTEESYGHGVSYDDFFVCQLRELLTGYGPIFSVWFDGANGEGNNGRKQYYDWDRYFSVVRELQPDAVISVCGPDVRWCGNEAGQSRVDEWSVVPVSLRDAERTASNSQKVDDGKFSKFVKSDEQDLGSREAILSSSAPLVWYPAEVNTSIRPGWFHHAAEDEQVRTADELFNIYCGSVGGNACFLLNVPPNASGLVCDEDRAALESLGILINDLYARNTTPSASITLNGAAFDASERVGEQSSDEDTTIIMRWASPVVLDGAILEEAIDCGQQVEEVIVVLEGPDGRRELQRIGSIGYRRILRFDPFLCTTALITIAKRRGRFEMHVPRFLSRSL